MKKTTIALLLFPFALAANNLDKVLTLHLCRDEIIIDGKIDSLWEVADSVADFVQFQPYHGAEPSHRTVSKMLTTKEALYCLIVCWDEKQNIQNHTGMLDGFGGDIVSLMIDTFGNKTTAYKFAVSASGVRADCWLLDDARNRDYSWDGIWFAESRIYDWGYVVEMKIPYKSIQYNEQLDEWGLDFDRYRPVNSEDIYWCPYEENEGQRISKFGKLVFQDFKPTVRGVHMEIYPVGISKATYLRRNQYDISPDAGVDIFYNPSPKLTFQFTANPDFAQIEADPYEFNISRYETYYSERRPFFTEGNEIFMASGRQRNTNFYQPLELFYSRRIGKKLADGSEVPLLAGTKAFGRINQWEYGSFLAMTGKSAYVDEDGLLQTEDQAYFASARLKRQIMDNSSLGFLMVGKQTAKSSDGVIDIDGAFRKSSWQLAYQLARSFKNSQGDFAGSAGFTMITDKYLAFMRGRYIGDAFNIYQVGFVPWTGTWQTVAVVGPRWYYEQGFIRSILIYMGGFLGYTKEDDYIDRGGVIGFNMQFRNNWGYEIEYDGGASKDLDVRYTAHNISFNTWINTSPKWHADFYCGYSKTYNFSREYLGHFSQIGGEISWRVLNTLQIGTSANMFVEGNPDGAIEDITYNARPFFSATPINDLNFSVYFDNLFLRSSDRTEQTIFGFLFSYNFSPKSWIYLAINESRTRNLLRDDFGNKISNQLAVQDRAGVLKIKYLYYL